MRFSLYNVFDWATFVWFSWRKFLPRLQSLAVSAVLCQSILIRSDDWLHTRSNNVSKGWISSVSWKYYRLVQRQTFSTFVYRNKFIRFCGYCQYRRRRAIGDYHHRLTIIVESNKEKHNPTKLLIILFSADFLYVFWEWENSS